MTHHHKEEISDRDIWDKIVGVPRGAGSAVIRSAITLYVLLREADIPVWAKVSIVAALGYFICPFDAIPDFLPGGFIDDLAAMALLVGQLTSYIDDNIRERVERLLPEYWRSDP
jgi:uncharacterized membrane protein YkvA (DUF1232 family)